MKKKCLKRLIPIIFLTPLIFSSFSCSSSNVDEGEPNIPQEDELYKGNITFKGNTTCGKIEFENLDSLDELVLNQEIKLIIIPNANYELSSVKINGEDVTSTLTFKIDDLNKDYEIEVIFTLIGENKPVPDPEPGPDPTPTPSGKEVVDGVTYTYQDKFVIEKIYDPKYIGGSYSYSTVDKQGFYEDAYSRALTYNDAIARSNSKLLSGDINIPTNLPNYRGVLNPKSSTGDPFYNARCRYIFKDAGYKEVIGYILNDTDGDDSNDTIIYKGGAYISMDEVSAYLFAFHEVPANWIANKNDSGQKQAVDLYGKFGRVNNGKFSGNVTRYPYQPILTGIDKEFSYRECDRQFRGLAQSIDFCAGYQAFCNRRCRL